MSSHMSNYCLIMMFFFKILVRTKKFIQQQVMESEQEPEMLFKQGSQKFNLYQCHTKF